MLNNLDKETLLKTKALLEKAEAEKKDEYKGKGYFSRREYEAQLKELGYDGSVIYELLNRVERKVGDQWYAVAKDHAEEFGKDSPLHWNFEVHKDDARRAQLWSKIFAYDAKNERNENGVLIDYKGALILLQHGSPVMGESREWAIAKAILCSSEDAKQLVAHYDTKKREDYVMTKFGQRLRNCQTRAEVERFLKDNVDDDCPYHYSTLASDYIHIKSNDLFDYLEGLPAEKGKAQENQ